MKILDCLLENFTITETQDSILCGTPFEKIAQHVHDFRPDIVGISVPFSAQSETAKAISTICKRVNPKNKIVLGGPHASVRYKELLEAGACDFCVIGEGEETFFEFVNYYDSKSVPESIDGMAYKKKNRICYKPRRPIRDLDTLPLPAYESVDLYSYLSSPYLYINRSSICKNSVSMVTSRGCPFNCVFCSIKLHMGRRYRAHSVGYVIKHMRYLIEHYGITNFHFEDDNFSFERKRFEEILDEIIDNQWRIRWDTPNGIRADTLDLALLEKVKKSGCVSLTIGIESGDEEVLRRIVRKNLSLGRTVEVAKYCKQLGIQLRAFYVIGFPGETIRNIERTMNFALRLFKVYDAIPHMFFATPLYGTELHETCIRDGLIDKEFTDQQLSAATGSFGSPLISTKEFSKEDLTRMMRQFQLSYQRRRIAYFARHPLETVRKLRKGRMRKSYLQQLSFLKKGFDSGRYVS